MISFDSQFSPPPGFGPGPLEPKARVLPMSYTDKFILYFEVNCDKSRQESACYSDPAFIELLEKLVVEYNLIPIPYYQRQMTQPHGECIGLESLFAHPLLAVKHTHPLS